MELDFYVWMSSDVKILQMSASVRNWKTEKNQEIEQFCKNQGKVRKFHTYVFAKFSFHYQEVGI